jgi:hypothetical protein
MISAFRFSWHRRCVKALCIAVPTYLSALFLTELIAAAIFFVLAFVGPAFDTLLDLGKEISSVHLALEIFHNALFIITIVTFGCIIAFILNTVQFFI